MIAIEKFRFQNIPSVAEGGLTINAEIRVVQIDGDPWFVAKDVCDVLGVGTQNLARDLDQDEQGVFQLKTPGGEQPVKIVNESGLYSLVLRSRKPAAKVFKKWVTSEVLPTIRKTGAYVDPASSLAQKIAEGDVEAMMEGFAMTLKVAQEARAALKVAEAKIENDAPMVKSAEEFFDTEGLYSLREAARALGVPPLTFNDTLRGWNWIDEHSTAAKAYSVSMGYAKNRIYIHPGSGAGTNQGRLTNKGLERAAIKLDKEGTWAGYAKAG